VNLNGQDWESVVISKRRPGGGAAPTTSKAAVAAARATGAAVETVKKATHGASVGGGSLAKLDNETENFQHEHVSSELKKQIMAARLAKKLTQAQLAQQINERPQTVQEYESGKAIPNGQVLSKMSRVLGVTLKKSGAPAKPAKK
jgi:putative transcription factor